MKSTVGKIGKVVVVKFEDNDDLINGLEKLSRTHKIKSGIVLVLGALRKADIVAGPKRPVVPPEPNFIKIKDTHEVFGVGSVFWEKNKPKIHLHSGLGRKKDVFTGCIRGKSKVFLLMEAFIIEIKGIRAGRKLDPKLGLTLLSLS